MSAVSILWEDTNGYANKYRCDLSIYLITVLSSSYGIIMNPAINEPGHGKSIVDVLNAADKPYLEGGRELIGKLVSKDTTNISMLPSDSKDVFFKFSYQSLHILINK